MGRKIWVFRPIFLMKNPQFGDFRARKRKIYQILTVNNK